MKIRTVVPTDLEIVNIRGHSKLRHPLGLRVRVNKNLRVL